MEFSDASSTDMSSVEDEVHHHDDSKIIEILQMLQLAGSYGYHNQIEQ